jgi:flagellar protein FliO/FliZ
MFEYILRLFILVPMIGGLAWGSLWLWRKAQTGLPMQGGPLRAAHMVDVVPLGPGSKLAVVAFGGRELLVAVTRTQITLLAEDTRENAGA